MTHAERERPGPVTAHQEADGSVTVSAPRYRLTFAADGSTARLRSAAVDHLELQLPGALDRTGAVDETLSLSAPALDLSGPGPVVTVRRRSTAWREAETRVVCTAEGPEASWLVRGHGDLESVALFATRAALGGRGTGLRPSGHDWATLFTPRPGPPRRLLRGAGESAVLGVCGDARPGRGHWFFTPPPLCLALTGARLPDDADPAAAAPGGWCTLGVGAPVSALNFTQLHYVPSDQGWHLRLDYEAHTRVDGVFRTPEVLVSPGHGDPYAGLRAHRHWLRGHGWAPDPGAAPAAGRPGWWSEPMFCGWGAQMARARDTGRPAPGFSTREEYDRHLAVLGGHGLVPGTVVIDDKWQRVYGSWEPDADRWPDLRGWIAERHAAGQKVLLWWRAWASEGVPQELCVRTPDGHPVALDPGHPRARDLLAANITRMLARDGLDADGLKIDFTADTPSGHALSTAGHRWGIALLYDQLATIHRAAKGAKPDALVVTHTPHPAFADVTDMIRLNDMLRLDDPDPWAPVVPQMRYRAAVAAASCPHLLIDTDDWCAPDRDQWRAYGAVKEQLGVPALYVTTHLDRTGEPLQERDYAALRAQWARHRGAR
ncbi:hypothetical protein GCM10018793_20600 [Streptomyces sulfonofaciens]|uniref:Uncharacterized protein n=1 Tax=Streptomyces sulfonofaciens TaxID=68272 RepID=A0A919KX21_9ACTN|nr:hypothetical protein [Streptomyces sulfonofaciens]GHH75912.1 hypothetical protein GCM10018793_20600 [Streptomyces sulfonofaciens]